MFQRLFLALLGTIIISTAAMAQNYKTALGIRLSSNDAAINNSISIKHFLSGNTALEGLLSFGDPLALGALVQVHHPISNAAGLNWLIGGGAYVGFGSSRNLGAQGVLGLDYKFPSLPINLTVDWKPELNLLQSVSFEPAAVGLSARFTLK